MSLIATDPAGFAPTARPPRADAGIDPGARLRRADRQLALAAGAWWAVAVAGQLLFAAYVAVFYGGALLGPGPEAWNKAAPHAWVAGRTLGNAAMAGHLLCAVVVVLGGLLQLVPALRRAAPVVHRWNGRVYVVLAMATAIDGAAMVGAGRAPGDALQHAGILFNAALVVAFGALAVRAARARRFDIHRRWALRLYLVVLGVWFFRVGLMAWVGLNHGPVGFDPKRFTGPALTVLVWAQTLVPLAVLQAWFHVRAGSGVGARRALAAAFVALALLTALGVAVAARGMWLPRLHLPA